MLVFQEKIEMPVWWEMTIEMQSHSPPQGRTFSETAVSRGLSELPKCLQHCNWKLKGGCICQGFLENPLNVSVEWDVLQSIAPQGNRWAWVLPHELGAGGPREPGGHRASVRPRTAALMVLFKSTQTGRTLLYSDQLCFIQTFPWWAGENDEPFLFYCFKS